MFFTQGGKSQHIRTNFSGEKRMMTKNTYTELSKRESYHESIFDFFVLCIISYHVS